MADPVIYTGYFEAWLHWWQATDIRTHELWGMKILWWARWGQIVAVLSSISLLIDLFKKDRITNAADRILRWNSGRMFGKFIKWLQRVWKLIAGIVIGSAGIMAIGTWASNRYFGTAFDVLPYLVYCVLGPMLFLAVLLWLEIARFFAIILGYSLMAISWAFNERHIEATVRFVAPISLLVGFHFSLLGS